MSCGASDQRSGPSAWATADSAGITIVDNWQQEWSGETAWRLADTPAISIGAAEDPEHHLHGPWDAIRLPDRRIVIGDRLGSALVFFDEHGAFLNRVGREGGGPGEFGALLDVAPWRGDSIIVFDQGHRRYSVFDAYGRFGRSYMLPTFPGHDAGFPTDLFADGAALVRSVLGNGERTAGLTETRFQLTRVAPDADHPVLLPDTVTWERYNVRPENDPIAMLSAPVLFTHERVAAAFGNQTVVGTTDRLFLDFYDASGQQIRIVRVHQDPIPISDEAHRTAAELLIDQATREGTRAALRRAIDGMPTRREMPAFGRWAWEGAPSNTPFSTWFRTDTDGNLWVLEFEPPGSASRRWYVISPSGRWLGAVRMPPGFEPFDIGPDYVLGWRLDDHDLLLVEMYDLLK